MNIKSFNNISGSLTGWFSESSAFGKPQNVSGNAMTRLIFHILCFFILASCGQDNSPSSNIQEDLPGPSKVPDPPVSKDSVAIDMGDYLVTIFNFALYDSVQYSGDSIFLTEDLGFPLENARMKIYSAEKGQSFVVNFAVKQTLTLNQAERVGKDLPAWTKQHEYAKANDSASYYLFTHYKRDSLARNLASDFKAIKKVVLKNRGDYITPEIDTVTSVEQLPVELWISESLIKIVQLNRDGKTRTKFIVCKSLYGC